MSQRPPHALALFDFARVDGELHGTAPLSSMSRLSDLLASTEAAPVAWTLRGYKRDRVGQRPQAMVSLRVRAELRLICQRCLQEMIEPLDETVDFRLVIEEPELTQSELEAEDEALPAEHPVDVLKLIEDQLILALPIVPMHDACPQGQAPGLSAARTDAAPAEERQHPFAHLRDLLGDAKRR